MREAFARWLRGRIAPALHDAMKRLCAKGAKYYAKPAWFFRGGENGWLIGRWGGVAGWRGRGMIQKGHRPCLDRFLLADLRGLTGSVANGLRTVAPPVPESEGPGAPSFVVWKYPGIGATRPWLPTRLVSIWAARVPMPFVEKLLQPFL